MSGIVWALLWPPAWAFSFSTIAGAVGRRRVSAEKFWEAWTCGAVGVVIGGFGDPAQLGIGIASGILAAVMWWLSRRRRKRSPRLIGAKSRALLAAVVARMRETAKPRPALRPVPGGAGA